MVFVMLGVGDLGSLQAPMSGQSALFGLLSFLFILPLV